MAAVNSSRQPFFDPNRTHLPTLDQVLGPRRQDLVKVIPVTVIYAVIFVTGVVGNISTCIVIARNRYMHTATNFYLVNLALSDILLLVLGLPLETYTFWSAYPWVFGEVFCVLRTVAAETSTYASILTITAFTVERYVAICHPMWIQTKCSLQRATRVIVFIWLIAGVCAVPVDIQYGVVYERDRRGIPLPESATCNIRSDRYFRQAFEMSTFLFFFAPMVVISALYAMIAATIRRSTQTRTYSDLFGSGGQVTWSDLRTRHQVIACRAVIKMLGKYAYVCMCVCVHVRVRMCACVCACVQSC